MKRVAIIHDWLTGLRGGEKCLIAFLKIFPQAEIFTLLHVPGSTSPEIDRRVVKTSFLQKLPGIKSYYRLLLPLYPLAVRGLKPEGYDLVISLSHAAAKNIETEGRCTHVCYCFTPMRYIWDQAGAYFGKLASYLAPLINYLRRWDREGAKRVTHFIGISRFISARIRCFYKRESEVIYPPVSIDWITPIESYSRGKAFLYAGALVPYKRADLLVDAFNRLGHELWIAGRGPEEKKLKARAARNIKFIGAVSDIELAALYRDCRALLFPAVEDFGMIPIECLASGRPVIGTYAGALKESLNAVKHWNYSSLEKSTLAAKDSCGVFIKHRTRDPQQAIIDSVNFFIEHEPYFSPHECRRRAELFSPARFFNAWSKFALRHGIFNNDAPLEEASQSLQGY